MISLLKLCTEDYARDQLLYTREWYKHQPESVIENDKVKILWDFNIYVDRFLEAKPSDIVVVKKEEKEGVIIDTAVPADQNIEMKESEKMEKYQELATEITKMWDIKTKTVPIVVAALGAKSIQFNHLLGVWKLHTSIETIQKSAVLGAVHILRKVLAV